MKTCTSCAETKPVSQFYKHKSFKDGYKTQCKTCETVYAKQRYLTAKEEGLQCIKNKRESSRIYSLKRKFGITVEQYNDLLEQQNHCCAVCGRHQDEFKKKFAVDHAHTESKDIPAGMIRGLLCYICNTRIVGDRTNPEIFQKTADYLRRHTGWKVPDAFVKPKRKRRKKKKIE